MDVTDAGPARLEDSVLTVSWPLVRGGPKGSNRHGGTTGASRRGPLDNWIGSLEAVDDRNGFGLLTVACTSLPAVIAPPPLLYSVQQFC